MPASLERIGHVVGGVARRRDRLDGPAIAANDLAIGERAVRLEVGVVGGIRAGAVADMQRPRRAMRAFGEHGRAGRLFDRGHARRMVAMGVRHEDVRHGLAAHGVKQRRVVRRIVGTGIDDRDLAAADDVADRALEGERARIVAQDAPHARHRLVDLAGNELELLVVWDVFGHAALFSRIGRRRRLLFMTARSGAFLCHRCGTKPPCPSR